jgi:peptidoglycan hydrolase-like protein with peptidoglycan-binding domain
VEGSEVLMPKLNRVIIWATMALLVGVLWCSPVAANRPVLREGDKGPYVYLLQHLLTTLNYLDTVPDGHLGTRTNLAIRAFQHDAGLVQDGIVGSETWGKLETIAQQGKGRYVSYRVRSGDSLWSIARRFDVGINVLERVNNISDPSRLSIGQELSIPTVESDGPFVELLPWAEVHPLFENFSTAVLTDVETGIQLKVRRYYGHYHADVEPLTADDTQRLKEIYNGSWSWDRRAVMVELKGRYIAASINGFPHGGAGIRDNDFPGHFCLHFLGSQLHKNHQIDPAHQQMILRAAGYSLDS